MQLDTIVPLKRVVTDTNGEYRIAIFDTGTVYLSAVTNNGFGFIVEQTISMGLDTLYCCDTLVHASLVTGRLTTSLLMNSDTFNILVGETGERASVAHDGTFNFGFIPGGFSYTMGLVDHLGPVYSILDAAQIKVDFGDTVSIEVLDASFQ